MWKQNSQRLMVELHKLRSELVAETKHRTSVQMELSEIHSQFNGLQELERLRLLMEEPRDNIKKEWEKEIKFQKEVNADLALQLKRSQEANLELVFVLREMEKQQMKINNLSVDKEEIEDMDTYSISSEDNKITSSESRDFPEDIRKEIRGSCIEETVVQKNEETIPIARKTLKFFEDLQGLYSENGEYCRLFIETDVLRKKLQVLKQSKLKKSRMDIRTCRNSASSFLVADFNAVMKISELFTELYECFQKFSTNERKQMDSPSLMASLDYKSNFRRMERCENEGLHAGEQAEVIFNKLIHLKNLFEVSFSLHGNVFKSLGEKPNPGVAALAQAHTKLKNGGLYENPLCTCTAGVESLHLEFGLRDPSSETNGVIDSLWHENLLNEKEIESLKHCKKELEAHIASIEEEKGRTEADVTDLLGKSSVDPQVLANDIIYKTSLKLISENDELEVHLLELENENICLSERICGLEAVLRHLTDEKESTCYLLQDSQSNVGKLQNKVCELGNEIMEQKLDLKEKLQDRQKQIFEALEESKNLKIENKKLQAIVDSIMEEHSLLQITNSELRKQKINLQDYCAILEVEVKDTLELFSAILKEVKNLEASFCRMLKEISLKEKSMNGDLDALVREIQRHNANLAREDSLLNQMYLEKTAEVDNLERKVVHLMKQMSTTFDENEREASAAVLELSCLREDKVMLEAALQEAHGKLRLCESKIDLIHKEAERKVLGVIGELAVSKQNQDILMDCHRKVLSSLENVKNGESKLKNVLRRHELKMKASENDRKNLAEEVSALKIKLQKMAKLQGEVMALKKSLIESEHENKCLKASFKMLFEDYEKLKAKNVTSLEEISDMQKVASKLGDYKRSKTALEEKIWRLEWELAAKEASCTLQSKMKNELARLTRTNSQLKRKVKFLEEEKEEFFKRVQEEPKQQKEEMQNHEESINWELSCEPRFLLHRA